MDAIELSGLLHLSREERIQFVDNLWYSIAAAAETQPDALPLSEAQRQEIRRRSAAHRQNPAEARPL